MRFQSALGALALGFVSSANALVTYSPGGPSFSIAIPSDSQISATTAGSIYVQMSAPSTYQWVGFGMGSQMKGSKIFLMYTDGTGNVTVSVRDGTGQELPELDSTLTSSVSLLAGSGVVGSNIVANILCTACTLASSATSTSSPWIAAWGLGSAIDSTSPSFAIAQHADKNKKQAKIDLSSASVSSNSNPFLSSSSGSASSSGTGTATATSSSTSATATSGSSSDDDSSSGADSEASVARQIRDKKNWDKAHGILSAVSVVLLFPMGAVFFRVAHVWWLHAIIQTLALVALLFGLYFGVKVANLTDDLFNCAHTILGIVAIVLFIIQPFFGYIHHLRFKSTGGRTIFSHIHIWVGRFVLLLGIVAGGLGLDLADNSNGGKIAYSVISVVVFVIYVGVLFIQRNKGGNSAVAEKDRQHSYEGGDIPLSNRSHSHHTSET